MDNKNEPKLVYVGNSHGFMGIKIEEGKIEVHVPKVYREKSKKELLAFLESISLAKTINNEDIESGDNEFVGEMWPIESYLWIINDYLENGYFYNREKKYFNDNKGKIDWKRTLKTVPIYSNGNIIYDKLITSRMSASNDIVAQIYKICLSISLKRIGWVFDYNFRVNVQQHISNKEMIYIIQKELSSTFEDIKRLRFKQMLKILKGIKKDNALSDKATYGITNYYYVVERMIDKLFMGIDAEELKEFYPSAYWQIEDENEKQASLLQPDTIHKRDNHIYIIDSKMYKYGFTGEIKDLPQTSSILKQIAYSDYIKNSKKYENIRNIFVIPYDKELEKFKEKYKAEDFVYIGKAYGKWKDKNDESGYVFTFLIDYMYLLEQYNKNDIDLVDKLYIKINEKYKTQ